VTSRFLPQSEWYRLDEMEVSALLPSRTNDDCKVLVVETEDGTIAGVWALVGVPHLEGLEIAPTHRQGGAVGRRLLQAMSEYLTELGIQTVVTGAATADMEGWLERIGATKMPVTFYALTPEQLCQQRS
jgi:N-acetylglutamate synthase-like GNAT family acetyltransferase